MVKKEKKNYMEQSKCKKRNRKPAKREEFPGSPTVRTLRFHCWEPGFDPTGDLRSHKLHCVAENNNKKLWREKKKKTTYTDKNTF